MNPNPGLPNVRRCLPVLFGLVLTAAAPSSPPAAPGPRKPLALAWLDGGARLLVAQGNGRVAVLDAAAGRVLAEAEVGRALADLAASPDGRRLLAVDPVAGEVLALRRDGDGVAVAHRQAVAPDPAAVAIAPDGTWAAVTSRLARRVTLLDLPAEGPPVVRQVVSLPFAPRPALALANRRLVVADAFGGQVGLIDAAAGAVLAVRSLPGHNVRGLALAPDGGRLLLTQQLLYAHASTSKDDIHWGNLLTNHVRSLAITDVTDPQKDLLAGSKLDHLGEAGLGAGDPEAVAVLADGRTVATLAGVGELAVKGAGPAGTWQRVPVGARPTALAVAPDGKQAFVALTHEDAIAVVDLQELRLVRKVPLGPPPVLTAEDRGERIYYNARRSHDGWLSCHSCHPDGHTPGLLADTTADGTSGTPKRIPTLRGTADTSPWSWAGRMARLEDQVRHSLRSTMHGPNPSDQDVADVTAFLKRLPPLPRAADLGWPHEEAAARRGEAAFRKFACDRCHAPPAYTTPTVHDVGLRDEAGLTKFNPPSLRGVAHGGPYFHDGRAATLDEVLGKFKHQLPAEATAAEMRDLGEFLRGL